MIKIFILYLLLSLRIFIFKKIYYLIIQYKYLQKALFLPIFLKILLLVILFEIFCYCCSETNFIFIIFLKIFLFIVSSIPITDYRHLFNDNFLNKIFHRLFKFSKINNNKNKKKYKTLKYISTFFYFIIFIIITY